MTALAPILQGFFTERLAQRRASAHTVAAYRDTFRLLLRLRPAAARATAVGARPGRHRRRISSAAFLDHLEAERSNSIATRNARLAAIHSLFSYAALRCPEHAATHPTGPGDTPQTRRLHRSSAS